MLPEIRYTVDSFHGGQFAVTKMVKGQPAEIVHKCWDAEEAKRTALEMQLKHIAENLFPYDQGDKEGNNKTDVLVSITRTYFQDLLRILPNNDDAQYARSLVRQAFNFARTAILMDGMV